MVDADYIRSGKLPREGGRIMLDETLVSAADGSGAWQERFVSAQSPGVPLTGPLLGDPIWREMQGDPRLIGTLAPVRETLVRERAEVMALGAG